jgi:hypothetical protein
MSILDDLVHTIDRACDKAADAIHKKLTGQNVDGSDVDPAAPQDTVGAPIPEGVVEDYADQIMTENSEDFKKLIKKRLTEKLSGDESQRTSV